MGIFNRIFKGIGGFLSGGVGSLLGDVYGAYSARHGQESANRTNIALQREQQAWEERMSNTAIQRQVKDYQAAGLNPMLATGAGGASTPNVAPARVESTSAQSSAILANAVSKMASVVMTQASARQSQEAANTQQSLQTKIQVEMDNIRQAERTGKAQEKAAIAQAGVNALTAAIQEVNLTEARATVGARIRQTIAAADLTEAQKKAELDMWDKVGEQLPWVRTILSLYRSSNPSTSN